MKFYRMDADHPDWPVWDILYDEVGRRDFHKAKVLYHDLYGYLAQSYAGDDAQRLRVVLSKVAQSTRISRPKVAQMLPKVGRVFAFEYTVIRSNAAGEPLVVDIFYPNFLNKQTKFRRTAEGKFSRKDDRSDEVTSDRQDKTREDKTRSNIGGNRPGLFPRGLKTEASEIIQLIVDQEIDPKKGAGRPSRDAVSGLAKDMLEEFGIHVIKDMKEYAKTIGVLGKVRWDPQNMREVANDIRNGRYDEVLGKKKVPSDQDGTSSVALGDQG